MVEAMVVLVLADQALQARPANPDRPCATIGCKVALLPRVMVGLVAALGAVAALKCTTDDALAAHPS